MPVSYPYRRAALLFVAAMCAVAAVLTGPTAADAVPKPGAIGGAAMGTMSTVQSKGTRPIPSSVNASSFVVAEVTSGAIYAARRPHWQAPPASTLKTLTTLAILRTVPLDHTVTMQRADVAGVECTCVGMTAGRDYQVGSLLRALLMRSGNDVAEVVAKSTGNRSATLKVMNALAADLQADDTHATTPSGLDGPGQHTSAYDLALINRAAFSDPRFRSIIGTKTFSFGPVGGPTRRLTTQNELLRMGYAGQLGAKNGWTTPARHTFVGAATRNGRTFLVTLMAADRPAGSQAAALLDWAFGVSASASPIGKLVEPRSALAAKVAAAASRSASAAASVSASASAQIARQRTLAKESELAVPPLQSPATALEVVKASDTSRVPLQTSFSLGAVGFAALALLPGRRPGRRPRRRLRR
jgi:D-alanyl-D-alanine carboxypeptidase (penicillin-binding protein 5/6)